MVPRLVAIAHHPHIARMERHYHGPDAARFQRIADEVVASLPERFREQLGSVVMQVEEFATPEQLSSVDLSDKWTLSGLYSGIPLTESSIWQSGQEPPRIWLFRQPLLAEMAATGVGLEELVRHVVIHEAGHHFGFSDDDMHWLEDHAG